MPCLLWFSESADHLFLYFVYGPGWQFLKEKAVFVFLPGDDFYFAVPCRPEENPLSDFAFLIPKSASAVALRFV